MDENVEQARPGGDCGLGILRESLFWCFVRKKPSLRLGKAGNGERGVGRMCVSCREHDGVIRKKQKRFGWVRSVGSIR